MNFNQFLSELKKFHNGRNQECTITSTLRKCVRLILTILTFAFGSGNLYAQHLFSVSYNDLSKDNARQINEQVVISNVSIESLNRSIKGEYSIPLSSVQNTKIIILNEETGQNVVITPMEEAPAQFLIPLFFIEELRQSVLGDADHYLMIETGTDFSVRSASSVSRASEDVFIPTYFYGNKENKKEALPKDRQIVHIFREKPRLIPAFPNDPENLRYVAHLEEEMGYYVFMYKLPDGTLCIYDEHFKQSENKNSVSKNTRTNSNLQFNLSGNLNSQQQATTMVALDTWSAQLAGSVPIDINVTFVSMGPQVLGGSYFQPHFWNPVTQTWYCSSLGNQLAGYNVVPGMRDIRLEINSDFSWYYGTSAPPSGQYDFLTVMLHEVTHGLGFSRMINNDGNYRYTTSNGSQTNTNYPGIYDCQLFQGTSGTNLTNLSKSERAALVVSNNLYSGRPNSYLLAANGGVRVKMYAPSNWVSGSSVSHWDSSVTFSTFMKYYVNSGFRCIVINGREISMMRDIGWEIPPPPLTISGPDVICYTGSYSISSGQSATWSVSSGYSVSPTTGTSTTVTAPGNLGYTGYLSAVVNGVTISRTLTTCDFLINGPSTICNSGTYSLSNGLSAEWSVSSGFSLTHISTTSVVVVASGNDLSGTLSATVNGVTAVKSITSCSITGPSTICNSDSYSLNSGQSATWSVSSGFTVSPTTGSSTTVKASSSNGQSGTLTATISGLTVTKSITACNSNVPYITGPDVVCKSSPGVFTVVNGTVSQWNLSSSLFTLLDSDATTAVVTTSASQGEIGVIIAVLTSGSGITKKFNACVKSKSVFESDSYITFYPNPVDNILTIEIDFDAAQDLLPVKASLTFDVRLFDGQGNMLRQTKTQGGTVQFNVSNLTNGIYYLHIYDGVNSTPEIRQIMVER